MKTVWISSPGRFPTVDHDPGAWWSTAAASHELVRFSANAAWWHHLCSDASFSNLLHGWSWTQRLRRRLELAAAGNSFADSARGAHRALGDLKDPAYFGNTDLYVETLSRLNKHLENLGSIQSGLEFSLESGVRVRGLDYSDSSALSACSKQDSSLSRTVEASLEAAPRGAGLYAFTVTCAEDLMTAMIAARILRSREPKAHLCLADHGYENFSLHPHMTALREKGTLTEIFDTVLESKNERDSLLPGLLDAVEKGDAPKGFLTLAGRPDLARPAVKDLVAPPAEELFAHESVVWTRISPRRCYWSRCAFCVQNNKYEDARPPSLAEVGVALDRVETFAARGTRVFIFSDEALSPAMLQMFSAGLIERGLNIRWACRSKLEKNHDRALFQQLAQSGCFEVLYGLESVSERVLGLMDKQVRGLDKEGIRDIFKAMGEAGVGTHANLIGAFPGDTVEEVEETVDFLIETLPSVGDSTFLLNRFALFPNTPVAAAPEKFGIDSETPSGDMPSALNFWYGPALREDAAAVIEALPRLREKLSQGLGWGPLLATSAGRTAFGLYSGSGHGALFKASKNNPFRNPLKLGVTA